MTNNNNKKLKVKATNLTKRFWHNCRITCIGIWDNKIDVIVFIISFQINNGKLFKDWNSDQRAKYAFVFNKDGSSEVYDSTTPASEILKKGADMYHLATQMLMSFLISKQYSHLLTDYLD